MKDLLQTDTNETGPAVNIADTRGLGFIPLQIDFAAGVSASVTIKGRVGPDMDWVAIGPAFTAPGLYEITRLAQLQVTTSGVTGGAGSPKVHAAILDR